MPGAKRARGEDEVQPGNGLLVAPCSGLLGMLRQDRLSDLTVRLPGGKSIAAHRLPLAASSEVLRAKFEGSLRDAAEQEWAPEVGSAAAWEWLLGWMYGSSTPLPPGLFVEVLALADHFQVAELLDAIAALPIPDCAADLVGQLLDVWACPQVLQRIARECIPRVAIEGTILQHLRLAKLPNVALCVRFVPLISEVDRVRLLRALLQSTDGCPREFPECFLDAVRWDLMPTEVLASGISGNVRYLEEFFGLPIPITEKTRGMLINALISRSYRLETQVSEQSVALGPSGPISKPLPGRPEDGLFAWMVQQGCAPEIELSSRWSANDEPDDLFSRTPKWFMTDEQSSANQPWIELRATPLHIHPEGVGLLHGRTDSSWRCQSFVLEATLDDGDWTAILARARQPLGPEATVLRIPTENSAGKLFNRFRLRMTGPNTSNSWFLALGWFEVFGTARAAVLQQLTQDVGLAEGPLLLWSSAAG